MMRNPKDDDGDEWEDEPPPPPLSPNIRIVGIEQTQGTQFFNINGQGTGLAPDNSLRLLSDRTTVFRVYVDVRQVDARFPVPTQITGALDFHRTSANPTPADVTTLTPINGPIPATPAANIRRVDPDSTLNFRLPGWLVKNGSKGTVSIGGRVWDPLHPGVNAYSSRWFANPPLALLPGGPLPLHVVRIVYTGPDATGAPMRIGPPTEQDAVNTLFGSFITRTYPVSGISLTGTTIAECNADLGASGPSGCGPGWNALMAMLRRLRTASNSSAVYVGLLPRGVPTGGVLGCGGGGVAAGFVSDSFTPIGLRAQSTLAQEIAHAYGRLHAPCLVPASNIDAGYPTYPTGPPGSVGEVGFDPLAGTTLDPAQTYDFMSYCWPTWTSPYTYRELLWSIHYPYWPRMPFFPPPF